MNEHKMKGLVTELDVIAPKELTEADCTELVKTMEQEGMVPYRTMPGDEEKIVLQPGQWEVEMLNAKYTRYLLGDYLEIKGVEGESEQGKG